MPNTPDQQHSDELWDKIEQIFQGYESVVEHAVNSPSPDGMNGVTSSYTNIVVQLITAREAALLDRVAEEGPEDFADNNRKLGHDMFNQANSQWRASIAAIKEELK